MTTEPQRPYVLPRESARVPMRTPAVPRNQTPLPDQPDDPVNALMRDRRIMQNEITSLNLQLAEAMATVNGLRAEVDARDRELGRMERSLGDREVTISRLRSYALTIRTRLAMFAEQAAAVHAEAMAESVASIMGEPEPDAEAEKPAGAPDDAAASDAAGARSIIDRLPRDRGMPPVDYDR